MFEYILGTFIDVSVFKKKLNMGKTDDNNRVSEQNPAMSNFFLQISRQFCQILHQILIFEHENLK